jgi:hypothetical protein
LNVAVLSVTGHVLIKAFLDILEGFFVYGVFIKAVDAQRDRLGSQT